MIHQAPSKRPLRLNHTHRRTQVVHVDVAILERPEGRPLGRRRSSTRRRRWGCDPRPPWGATASRSDARGCRPTIRCDPRPLRRATASRDPAAAPPSVRALSSSAAPKGDRHLVEADVVVHVPVVAILGHPGGRPPPAAQAVSPPPRRCCDPRPPRRATATPDGEKCEPLWRQLRSSTAPKSDRHRPVSGAAPP